MTDGRLLSSPPFPASAVAALHITDIESAINWWRDRKPSPDGITACAEVLALAEVYALMVYYHEAECDEASMPPAAQAAWLAWYATTPDAPCIAICSTSQGDAICKGCGRSFEEVQHWTAMSPAEKARHLAPHHAGRDGLALQPLCRARAARRAERGRRGRHGTRRVFMTRRSLKESALRLLPLAWPVFIGQLAVLAFSTVDTVMVARASALDLAALAIGASIYISVFVGLMGVVMAIGPIAGQLFGAGKLRQSGHETEQAVWLALALSVLGCAVLLWPEPFLALARAEPPVRRQGAGLSAGPGVRPARVPGLHGLPQLSTSRSRDPKAVMVLQLGGPRPQAADQTPCWVFGFVLPTPLGDWRVPALGAEGCGVATAIVMWLQLTAAIVLLRRDPFYVPFGLGRGLSRPQRSGLAALLRLGIPMGLAILIEVTGFTFMAFFISRIGATPVAGHQIAVNMISLMFMVPLALANASSVLVAQRLGRRRRRRRGPDRLGRPGDRRCSSPRCWVPGSTSCASRSSGLYTGNPIIVAAALPLLAWVRALPRRRRRADDRRLRAARAPHHDRFRSWSTWSRSG